MATIITSFSENPPDLNDDPTEVNKKQEKKKKDTEKTVEESKSVKSGGSQKEASKETLRKKIIKSRGGEEWF